MLVEDEMKNRVKWNTLTFCDFAEAICRVASMKHIPMDKEIKAVGARNIVEYLEKTMKKESMVS